MKTKSMVARLPRYTHFALAALLILALVAGCTPTVSQPIATPPTVAPPTAVPPTPVPPTAAPTAVPPTGCPTTAAPPTAVAATSTPAPTPATATSVDPMYYPNEPVAVVPPGDPTKPMVEAAYNTSIRSGPGTNYVVYGAFLGGSTAIATGISQDGKWYVISVPVAPGGMGWVDGAYLLKYNTSGLQTVVAPPVPPTVDLVPPAAGDPQATALTEVYVRTGPGDTYPAYGIAPKGSTARVIGKSQDGQWLTVRLDPAKVGLGYGWAAAAYVQASNVGSVPIIAAGDQPPAVTVPAPPSGVPVATAIDFVNIRSGPGYEYYVLGVANPGASAEVSGKSQDGLWWQVKVPTTYISTGLAWVSADWVVTSGTDSVPVVAAPPPPPTNVSTTPPPAGNCVLVSQTPADNTTYPLSYGFGVQWVLKNTSSTPWEQSEVDFVYQGAMNGQRLHQNGDRYDLYTTVQPGQTVTINGSLITPATPGQYGEAWALQMGNSTPLCTFWIIVNAK